LNYTRALERRSAPSQRLTALWQVLPEAQHFSYRKSESAEVNVDSPQRLVFLTRASAR
jgi:hypothetical protein